METEAALQSLSALAQEGRLAVFRLLVQSGPGGLAAGDIARRVNTAASTLSAQLLVLSNAGLIHARRDGRSIIYAADFARMGALLLFLTEDCCGGRAEICVPLLRTVKNGCPPRTRRA